MLADHFRQFSVERLMRFLVALGQDVKIVVRPAATARTCRATHRLKAGLNPAPMTDNDNFKTIRILKSRFTEVTRQAAAETTLDLYNVLTEAGAQITPEIRQLMLNAIHTTMTLAVVDLLNSENYTFEEG